MSINKEYNSDGSNSHAVSIAGGIVLAFIAGFCLCIAAQTVGIINFTKNSNKQEAFTCSCLCEKPDYTCTCPVEASNIEEGEPLPPITIGQHLPVWGWDWIEVVQDPSGREEEGGDCGIDTGGYLTVLGIMEEKQLIVRYISSKKTGFGTECSSGVVGTIYHSLLVRAEKEAIAEKEKSERIKRILDEAQKKVPTEAL